MFMAKSALIALFILSTQAFAEPTYVVPAEANINNKIVISVNSETGAVEYQQADGTFKALTVRTAQNEDAATVQTVQYYQDYNNGPCCGRPYYPPPCNQCGAPPYYYNQGNLWREPCDTCYAPRPPRVHVRKYHEKVRERDLYEYDVVPQDNYGPSYVDPRYDDGF